jgi:hypothetical protein
MAGTQSPPPHRRTVSRLPAFRHVSTRPSFALALRFIGRSYYFSLSRASAFSFLDKAASTPMPPSQSNAEKLNACSSRYRDYTDFGTYCQNISILMI